jgi:hypothetical protein
MFRLLMLTCLCFVLHTTASAQTLLKGKVVSNDSTKRILEKASVNNLRSRQATITGSDGSFMLAVQPGDSILISYVGYTDYTYYVRSGADVITKTFFLLPKNNAINGVRVSALTQYQKDSLKTARMFDKVIGYEQTASIASPVTSLYEQFSKKYKDLRKLQGQIVIDEKQKFVDSKYTYELINRVTGLQGDSVAVFMYMYPMEYKFARLANDAEIKMWIITNHRKYKVLAEKNAIAPSVEALIKDSLKLQK